ncbi:MAG TPA: homoserine O-acetyltransferase [Acidimicrobiales bacterium]|jgi:homoserine O-acetyltransferase|nr:homoserine O-acetyltransferase [Acidimicrobiales bacterium]
MAAEPPLEHPRSFPRDLPASGAWRPGDPVGERQFLEVATNRPFALEGGGVLNDVTIAYETWGELDGAGANAVLVCHALTGDSHAAGRLGHGHPTPGWWAAMIGPGKPLDTDRYYVVCANVLGGCQGSTGPSSIDPATGRPFGSRFPVVTTRDMVRAQARLANHLGVRRWLTVIGGSMGGMQVIEWAVMYPERVRSFISLASCMAASAWQIAWSAIGRTALALDSNWRGGDYYDAPPGQGPHRGLAVARALAQVTYRSDEVFRDRFDRELVDPLDAFRLWDRFQVESYLDYHGSKLVRRFDANTYLVLNKAMDLHDIGRGRGGIRAAVGRIVAPSLVASITSDVLYPTYQQEELRDALHAQGLRCVYRLIDSPQGHDGFLLEIDQIGPLVADFLSEIEKRDA